MNFAFPNCVISKFVATDSDALVQLFTSQAVRQFLGGPIAEKEALLRAEALIANQSSPRSRYWAIRPSHGASLVGTVSLDPHHDGADIELSYVLLPCAQGQGFATRAAALALDVAFAELQLPRVVAETQTANTPSINLLERLGFTFDREVVRFGAAQRIYSRTSETWRAPTI